MIDYFIFLFRRSNVIYLIEKNVQQLISDWTKMNDRKICIQKSKSYSFVLFIYFVIIFIFIEIKGCLLLERVYED